MKHVEPKAPDITLVRPSDFQRRNKHLIRTLAALRAHLDNRHKNGLIDAHAVHETPLGLLIDTANFNAWLRGGRTK